jgi:cell division protein FtsQ
MARKNGPTPDDFEGMSRYESGRAEVEDYSEAGRNFDTSDVLDSARPPEPDGEQESPFLRAKKRVPVRKGPLPKKAANRLKIVAAIVAGVVAIGILGWSVNRYALKSWRFRIDSSDQIQVSGNQNVARSQILEVFGADISRNVFAVPLEARRSQLEQIPWIESATLMRLLPNRIAVVVKERTPVAFVEIGSRIALIDASGAVMETPAEGASKYSFPVIVGFSDAEPLSTRAARMKTYMSLVGDLDSGGARYSQDLSEVDLSDTEDAKVTVSDGAVTVHLGNSNYLNRYKVYVSHVQEWKQQYGALKSVDLRYDNQVIVDPETAVQNTAPIPPSEAPEPAPSAKSPGKVVGEWAGATTAKAPVKKNRTATKFRKTRLRRR